MKRLRNVRQEKFCQAIVNSKSQVEAYQEAYPVASYETAKANASALLNNEKIANRITQILNDKGLTVTNLVEGALKDLIKGEKEVLGHKNKIITLKDNQAKAEGLKIALKLHKVLDNTEIREDNRQVNITINSPQDIERIIDKVKALKDNRDIVADGEIV